MSFKSGAYKKKSKQRSKDLLRRGRHLSHAPPLPSDLRLSNPSTDQDLESTPQASHMTKLQTLTSKSPDQINFHGMDQETSGFEDDEEISPMMFSDEEETYLGSNSLSSEFGLHLDFVCNPSQLDRQRIEASPSVSSSSHSNSEFASSFFNRSEPSTPRTASTAFCTPIAPQVSLLESEDYLNSCLGLIKALKSIDELTPHTPFRHQPLLESELESWESRKIQCKLAASRRALYGS